MQLEQALSNARQIIGEEWQVQMTHLQKGFNEMKLQHEIDIRSKDEQLK